MIGTRIAVLTTQRHTRRQIARALGSGGIEVCFLSTAEELDQNLEHANLIVVDCEGNDIATLEAALERLNAAKHAPPVVMLSIGSENGRLLELVHRHEISNLVAKHGAIRAVHPVVDERELLVTCEKVIRRNIFGIDKYVGSWGIVLHRAVVTGLADKVSVLNRFERFLIELDTPRSVIPNMVTVAEELIINAVVHAPHDESGQPKYESRGPAEDLVLEPHEYVDVTYACDGQRLMLSVTDRFGRLAKKTLYNYLTRGMSDGIEPELKPGGAGLGLSLSFRSIHQLIFNIQDSVRTEVIAGWYLRVTTAGEFRQVGKSLNLFWLGRDSQPLEEAKARDPRSVVRLAGRIDERTDLVAASEATVIDLRSVTSMTSRGLERWLQLIGSLSGRRLEIHACPEAFVEVAVQTAGVMRGVEVKTVLAPFECSDCGRREDLELRPNDVFKTVDRRCISCPGSLRFAAPVDRYKRFLDNLKTASSQ